jgi:hypothetical protein
MMLSIAIGRLQEKLQSMQDTCSVMQGELTAAKGMWPDHQIDVGAIWYGREEPPPIGMVWVSDGTRVWLIHSDGEGIPDTATAVQFWTHAMIPAPPSFIAGSPE